MITLPKNNQINEGTGGVWQWLCILSGGMTWGREPARSLQLDVGLGDSETAGRKDCPSVKVAT